MNADQLSQSAAFIAIKFYGLSQDRQFRSLFDDEVVHFYESIVQALPRPLCYYHYWLQFDWVRTLYIQSEELLLPGDLMHIIARKWYISKILNVLLDQGYEQLLVLGGGFDHVAFRCTQHGIPSLELDSPRMARLKKNFFEETYPNRLHPNITAAQLPQQNLSDILKNQQSIEPHIKTAIISEGFFDYLSPDNVTSTLSALQDYFTDPALLSTHFALNELSFPYRMVFRSSLSMVGEQLQFNASVKDFRSCLSDCGFIVDSCYNSEKITEQFISPLDTNLGILKGFYILSATGSS